MTGCLYNGDQVIAEYDGSNNLLRKYVYSTGIDEPIMLEDTIANEQYYYCFDALGSVSELTDNEGSIVEKYEYDVYGNTVIKDSSDQVITQSVVGNRYGFTGRRYEPETGLYYYRARYYSPSIGRFLQVDPLGYIDSMNLYSYVNNNPTRYVDPLGLCRTKKKRSRRRTLSGRTNFFLIAGSVVAGIEPTPVGEVVMLVICAWLVAPVSDSINYSREISYFDEFPAKKTNSNVTYSKSRSKGYWPGDKGAEEWGHRNGIGAKAGKDRFHRRKGRNKGSKANEDTSVNPDTGDIQDSNGESIGNLND